MGLFSAVSFFLSLKASPTDSTNQDLPKITYLLQGMSIPSKVPERKFNRSGVLALTAYARMLRQKLYKKLSQATTYTKLHIPPSYSTHILHARPKWSWLKLVPSPKDPEERPPPPPPALWSQLAKDFSRPLLVIRSHKNILSLIFTNKSALQNIPKLEAG